MQKIANQLIKILIIFICTAFSAFIYANITEKIFMIDIPYINTVQKTSFPLFISKVKEAVESDNQISSDDKVGFFGDPVGIRVPRINYYLDLQSSNVNNESWLMTNDEATFYTYGKSNAGVLGDTVVFGAENSRVMDFLALFVEGDRFVLNTKNGWEYQYKITKKIVVPDDIQYISESSDYNKIILFKQITSNHTILIVEAEYLNIGGNQQ